MTDDRNIRSILIVGGGTAGWMTAATFARILGPDYAKITLVESDEIGIIGVGEATIPQMATFNRMLGLDEDQFVRETKGSFKLGIQFVNWGRIGHRYFHPFGRYGLDMKGVSFHAYYLRLRQLGEAPDVDAWSLQAMAARDDKFMRGIDAGNSPLSDIAYAYHFDAGLYARFLRRYAEERGVVRREGRIVDVKLRGEDGFVQSVTMQDGSEIAADLFVDCSGFRGLIIEQALKAGYTDWSQWLPCNRAIAVPCASVDAWTPYTRSTAHAAGWQWRIPLQHRIGNGHVFSSRFMGEDEATAMLLANLDGEALAEPRTLRFTAGTRRRAWIGNVVAIGLSSGFLEPLESTSIHLIQSGIAKLLTLFPDRDMDPMLAERYNALLGADMDNIKDFLILHYHANPGRSDPFWVERREMALPETLVAREEQYRRSGRLMLGPEELFRDASWLAVLNGQEIVAEDYNPLADVLDSAANSTQVRQVAEVIKRAAPTLPLHDAALAAAMGG